MYEYSMGTGNTEMVLELGKGAIINGLQIIAGPPPTAPTTLPPPDPTTAGKVTDKPVKSVTPDKDGVLLRVNCGGPAVTDAAGNKWKTDAVSPFKPTGNTES